MNKKAIVAELTEAELLRIVTGSKEAVVMDAISHAAKFIYALNIKHGKDRVSTQLIFHTYKGWKGDNRDKQSRAVFFKDFKKYFQQQRDKNGTYYELNGKSFDMSDEMKWKMRKADRNLKSRRKRTN